MDSTVLVLVLGLATIISITLLLLRNQLGGGSGEAKVRFANLLDFSVKLDASERASAGAAVDKALAQRSGSNPRRSTRELDIPREARLARLLWVDDNPDGNLYETIALERLGRFVTKATSTEAGLTYLNELSFSLVITDLGRREGARAGLNLIARAREAGHTLPIIIYTMHADRHTEEGLAVGAEAVVDMPDDLLSVVEAALSQ